jgi:hypothetical protein
LENGHLEDREDDIKMDLREISYENGWWMELAQSCFLWHTLTLSVFNLWDTLPDSHLYQMQKLNEIGERYVQWTINDCGKSDHNLPEGSILGFARMEKYHKDTTGPGED